MTTIKEPICTGCKHFFEETPGATCRAFPTGIPLIIYHGSNKHKKPLKKQKNELTFEAKAE